MIGPNAEFWFADGGTVVAYVPPNPPRRMTCQTKLFERDDARPRPRAVDAPLFRYREIKPS